jgi:hypothetical protein
MRMMGGRALNGGGGWRLVFFMFPKCYLWYR